MINSSKFWFIIAVVYIGCGLVDIFLPPRTPMWTILGLVFIGIGGVLAMRWHRLMRLE